MMKFSGRQHGHTGVSLFAGFVNVSGRSHIVVTPHFRGSPWPLCISAPVCVTLWVPVSFMGVLVCVFYCFLSPHVSLSPCLCLLTCKSFCCVSLHVFHFLVFRSLFSSLSLYLFASIALYPSVSVTFLNTLESLPLEISHSSQLSDKEQVSFF